MPQMLDFRERSRLRRAMYAKPTILLLGAIAVLVARGTWGMYEKSREAILKRDKAQEELKTFETRKRDLEENIARLSSARGQEDEIRDRFMVAKDGEKVIIVATPEKETVHTVTVSDQGQQTIAERFKAAVGISGE